MRLPSAASIRNTLAGGALLCAFFVIAGRWDWLAGWGFVAVTLLTNTAYVCFLRWRMVRSPRAAAAPDATDDSHSRPTTFTYLYLGMVVLGALDGGRFTWSAMPAGLWFAGAGLYLASFVIVGWCAAINPYFGTVNRIKPRATGHMLVSRGPYRVVRHPGYSATMTGYLFGTSLMLQSWWSCVPALLGAARLLFAAANEDRVLLRSLEDYPAYAQRVPYRLFPGIW